MADFIHQDLSGSRFERVDLTGSGFDSVDFSGSRFHSCGMHDVVLRGGELANAEIYCDIENVRINGVDIGPLVEAELNRRDPERATMRPVDVTGFRAAWEIIERRWAQTVERARGLDPALLHESVDGEWSFIQTLRHLVFATDAWVRRGVLGEPSPWDPLDLPWDDMSPTPGVPWDRDVLPTLEEVLVLRRDRMATVRDVVAALTDESLAADTAPAAGPGWPPEGRSFPVRTCLSIVLNEEWEHRVYAERDLTVLESGSAGRD